MLPLMALDMTCFICATCGTQYAPSTEPPERCPVCEDDRQYVDPDGQRWTDHGELLRTLHHRIEHDGDLLGIGIAERFGIPQRALIVPTPDLNVMWDCISLVGPDALAAIDAAGGVDAIAISHPHFYASMVEWSEALGGVPILLHEADRDWIARPSPRIELWRGDRLAIAPELELVHLPGHFPGSAALHWSNAPGGRQALLAGDSVHVTADRHVTVMHSVPNYIPVGPGVIDDIARRLEGLDFDDLYGFTWGLNIVGDARRAVDRSLARYAAAIA
jgi:glyoxylase-like metal-dependent hydrolase (beta-lactamase superfamily II)